MILRRVMDHVRMQNWTAVALDFAIVVFGVFVGIQLGNWNDARRTGEGATRSLERLQDEVMTNIRIADEMLAKIDESSDMRAAASQAIAACDSSPEAADIVNTAINSTLADYSATLVDNSLKELKARDGYLSLFSGEFRAALDTYESQLSEEIDDLRNNNRLLWEQHVMRHSAVGAVLADDIAGNHLTLRLPLDEICNDPSFQRQYFVTTGFIGSHGYRLERFKGRAEVFAGALEKEVGSRR